MRVFLALLAVAAAATCWIVLRSPEPTYEPPSVQAADPVPFQLSRSPEAGETKAVFEVDNMCCNGCTGKLYEALTALDDVRDACVDFRSGTASALVAAGADLSELERALNFDKYVARRREP